MRTLIISQECGRTEDSDDKDLPKGRGCIAIKMTSRHLTHTALNYRLMTHSGLEGKTPSDVSCLCPLKQRGSLSTLSLPRNYNNFRFCDNEMVASSLCLANVDAKQSVQSTLNTVLAKHLIKVGRAWRCTLRCRPVCGTPSMTVQPVVQ